MVVITTRKRSLGQGNIFSSVCQEFCSWGGTLAGTPPWAGTPPRQVHLPWAEHPFWAGTTPGRYTPGQVHPLGSYTPWQVHPPMQVLPPWAGTPPRQVPPTPQGRYTPREQCMLGDTGNKRTVRILLECILVDVCRLIAQ